MFDKNIFLWALLAFLLGTTACSKGYHRVHSSADGQQLSTAERSERTALLVLPGVLVSNQGRRDLRRWLATLPYDVFFPELDCKAGLKECTEALGRYIEENHLRDYGRLHAFTFILGGWTLNEYLAKHPLANLQRIVYDRSPIQEQGPRVVLETFGGMVHWIFGDVVADLRDTPYLPVSKNEREIGLLIESKAMPFMRWQKERVLANGPLQWDPQALGQEYDDYLYVYLDHEELYSSMEVLGSELVHFFEYGHFSGAARRTPFAKDPFE